MAKLEYNPIEQALDQIGEGDSISNYGIMWNEDAYASETPDETVSAAAITSHDARLDAVETLLENGNVENLAAVITAHRHLRVRLAEALQRSGSGNPTTAGLLPEYIGQEYNDTTNKVCYRAFGLTAADWVALN